MAAAHAAQNDSDTQKNDTIPNYYYFQVTKHDVTNRLPASQIRAKTLKEGK